MMSILDDDTLRLSLAIDDDSHLGGLSPPSLHLIEPKVYLRVSGESGMIRPANKDNEVLSSRTSSQKVEPRARELHEDDHEIEEDEETEDDDMNDNYHHHYPYIESYREKYTKPDLHHPFATSPTEDDSSSSIEAPASTKPKQVWSEIIAQVTTPSSFNEINSSASEHRLADFHFRANLPSYFYNKYSSYSEEDLENVADFDDDHSKYFVKTKPRSVTASGSNIYSNFYYEPPSFSTKSVPIPVKTDRKQFVFASAKPPTNNHDEEGSQHLYVDDHEEDAISHSHNHEDDHELPQQDATIMTTTLPNFTTPQKPYDAEGSSSKIQVDQNNASNRPLDATTSQSILSKVIINNDPDSGTTPQYEEKSETTTTTTFLSGTSTTTEATTTTTDATSIPGVPGIDYPILDEIPQTGFDCKNQRYKGFFADIDTKCQAWHYCDFTDGHSTFLCPNGTLFSKSSSLVIGGSTLIVIRQGSYTSSMRGCIGISNHQSRAFRRISLGSMWTSG
ncbi:hypothetical protein Ocin01_14288 [Orchesella cincta]|uniref:Uncharacterized protein n=1 Tax=Orchesella cincta TaxID=48709 RepID=A0A1D2MHT9_ORCCI|nr:hypothetical protein Ocin01_14288 [Orchesella cincta]